MKRTENWNSNTCTPMFTAALLTITKWWKQTFNHWCWRRRLRVPWTARRSNQSILQEINPKYSLEGLMRKLISALATWCKKPTHWKRPWCWERLLESALATWCKEPTHWKRPWCWERLRARGEGGDWGWDGWMASLTQWTWVWANSGR